MLRPQALVLSSDQHSGNRKAGVLLDLVSQLALTASSTRCLNVLGLWRSALLRERLCRNEPPNGPVVLSVSLTNLKRMPEINLQHCVGPNPTHLGVCQQQDPKWWVFLFVPVKRKRLP